ncbi:MAG TPA: hypothetical protein PLU50_09180 [Pseudobdellovibrionaceae bacterium]|nr:hypothetical protein [Pseudobdellovibrionaceae bacterium]
MSINRVNKDVSIHKIYMKHIYCVTIFVLASIFCSPGAAQTTVQTKDTSDQTTQKRKTILNFEDELVEGDAPKGDLFYLMQQKNYNFSRLIKLREHFLPEMRRTSESVRRLRGTR